MEEDGRFLSYKSLTTVYTMEYVIAILIIFWIWIIYELVQSKNTRVRIKEDGTIWKIESVFEETETVVIEINDEFLAYYKDKYNISGESTDPINNKYGFNQVEFLR